MGMTPQQAFQRAYGASRQYTEDSLAGAGALKGIGISSISIDANNHLIITYERALPDGTTTQDAGVLPTGGTYTQSITTPSATWSIQHNLNTPWDELVIITTSTAGDFIVGEIDSINSTNNLLIVKFDKPFDGKAVIKK